MSERNLESERRKWLNLVNFPIWQILRILDENEPIYTRKFRELGFVGSQATLLNKLTQLEEWGMIERWRNFNDNPVKKFSRLADRGRKLLGLYDEIGEIVKEIRGGDSSEN